MQQKSTAQESDWKYLSGWLIKHTIEPSKDLPRVFYCVMAILGFAGLGIWVELLKIWHSAPGVSLTGLVVAVLTYFPTLVGPSAIQLMHASLDRDDKIIMSFALFALTAFLVVALILATFSAEYPVRVLTVGSACSIAAIWLWWIANGEDATYKKKPPADAATGGSTDRPLSGDLNGFEV